MTNKYLLKQWIFSIYPYYHKFTLFCAICFFSYKAITYTFPDDKPSIAWVIEVLAPDFWEQFSGGEATAPSDFLTTK